MDSTKRGADPDRLAICDEVDEVVDVVTTPDINPDTFRRRVKCLMISGILNVILNLLLQGISTVGS